MMLPTGAPLVLSTKPGRTMAVPVSERGAREGSCYERALDMLNRPSSVWDANLWLEARTELVHRGQLKHMASLLRCVRLSSDYAMKQEHYHVANRLGGSSTRVDLHRALAQHPHSTWLGSGNVAPEGASLKETHGVIPPPVLVSDFSALDVAASLRQTTEPKRPVVLVGEVCEFTRGGDVDCSRLAAFNPPDLALRTDAARYCDAAKAQVRDGQSSMQGHLCAAQDPYVLFCRDVTTFRGSRGDGYPFMAEPSHLHVVLLSLPSLRPSVQVVNNTAQAGGQSEWYADAGAHQALVDRLKLVGEAVLQEAEAATRTQDEQAEILRPIVVFAAPGCSNNYGHPKDAVASALKDWRRHFAPRFHSIFLCTGGRSPETALALAEKFDRIVNQQVYKVNVHEQLAEKFMPWHWDESHIDLCANPESLYAISHLLKKRAQRQKRLEELVTSVGFSDEVCIPISPRAGAADEEERPATPGSTGYESSEDSNNEAEDATDNPEYVMKHVSSRKLVPKLERSDDRPLTTHAAFAVKAMTHDLVLDQKTKQKMARKGLTKTMSSEIDLPIVGGARAPRNTVIAANLGPASPRSETSPRSPRSGDDSRITSLNDIETMALDFTAKPTPMSTATSAMTSRDLRSSSVCSTSGQRKSLCGVIGASEVAKEAQQKLQGVNSAIYDGSMRLQDESRGPTRLSVKQLPPELAAAAPVMPGDALPADSLQEAVASQAEKRRKSIPHLIGDGIVFGAGGGSDRLAERRSSKRDSLASGPLSPRTATARSEWEMQIRDQTRQKLLGRADNLTRVPGMAPAASPTAKAGEAIVSPSGAKDPSGGPADAAPTASPRTAGGPRTELRGSALVDANFDNRARTHAVRQSIEAMARQFEAHVHMVTSQGARKQLAPHHG